MKRFGFTSVVEALKQRLRDKGLSDLSLIDSLLLDYEIENPELKEIFEFTMQKIPRRHKEKFPCFSVWEYTVGPNMGAYVDGPNIYFRVNLLLKEPKDVQIGTIAHELAHICLGHYYKPGNLKDEYRADKLACRWGFTKEIKAMREKIGPPTNG